MLNAIVRHVRDRYQTRYPLMLTGPQLLEECYQRHALDPGKLASQRDEVAITYRDTRPARWPYAGLIGADGLIAFETPKREHYEEFGDIQEASAEAQHYTELL